MRPGNLPLSALAAVVLTAFPANAPAAAPPPPAEARGDPLPPGAVLRLGTMRLRHAGDVQSLAFSADGTSLLTTDGGPVCRWSVADGRRLASYPLPDGESALLLSPDGRSLLGRAGGLGGDLILRGVGGAGVGRPAFPPRKVGSYPNCFFSGDGRTLAVLDGPVARFTDAATGRTVRTVEWPAGQYVSLSLSHDGKTAIAFKMNSRPGVVAYDVPTGKKIRTLSPDEWVFAAAVSPDGRQVVGVALGARGQDWLRAWDLRSGKEQAACRCSSARGARNLGAFSPDGRSVAILAGKVPLLLWQPAGGEGPRAFPGADVSSVAAFSPDGKTLATAGARVRLWDVASGKEITPPGARGDKATRHALSANGRVAAAGSAGGAVTLWSLPEGEVLNRLPPQKDLLCIALSPDGRWLATGTLHGVLRLWDVATGKQTHTVQGASGAAKLSSVHAVAFSPDGRTLAFGGGDSRVRLWAVEPGGHLRALAAEGLVECLAFCNGGKWVLGGGRGFAMRAWDASTGKRVPLWDDAKGTRFAVSPDGKCVLSIDWLTGSALAVENVVTRSARERVNLREVVKVRTSDAAFSPDGRLVALGEFQNCSVWEVATWREVLSLSGEWGETLPVAFAADRTLVTGNGDGTALVWDLRRLLRRPARGVGLSAGEFDRLWADLDSPDPRVGFAAVEALAANPNDAVGRLRERLRPAGRRDPRQVARWLAELSDEAFSTREAAERALGGWQEGVGPALEAALAGRPDAEKARRLRRLLRRLEKPFALEGRLAAWRALGALEQAGTPGAERLLRELAGGADWSPVTREAGEALRRLGKPPAADKDPARPVRGEGP